MPLCGGASPNPQHSSELAAANATSSVRHYPTTNSGNGQIRRAQLSEFYAFSSRFSSFRKRQSVASEMILWGADLINPVSCIRNA